MSGGKFAQANIIPLSTRVMEQFAKPKCKMKRIDVRVLAPINFALSIRYTFMISTCISIHKHSLKMGYQIKTIFHATRWNGENSQRRTSPVTTELPPHFTETLKLDYSLSVRALFIIPLVLMSLVSFPSSSVLAKE